MNSVYEEWEKRDEEKDTKNWKRRYVWWWNEGDLVDSKICRFYGRMKEG